MELCKYCWQKIDWITNLDRKPVPVDPDPVFVIEGSGPDTFLDDMGTTITGRQAAPEEELPELPVAFVPHRKTCRWARKPAPLRVERGAGCGKV